MRYLVTVDVASASEPNPAANKQTLQPHFEAENEAKCRVLVEGWLASTGRVHVGAIQFEPAPETKVIADEEPTAVSRTDDEAPKRQRR